jgi:hypothetical protein
MPFARPICCEGHCGGDLTPVITVPAKPDHWVRLTPTQGWECSDRPAGAGEYATPLAYRCSRCGVTMRLVEPHLEQRRSVGR